MYTMRRTPKSSFMVGTGDATLTISATPVYAPTVASPPFAPPGASATSSPNYLMYALVGGGALVAYLLLFRSKKG